MITGPDVGTLVGLGEGVNVGVDDTVGGFTGVGETEGVGEAAVVSVRVGVGVTVGVTVAVGVIVTVGVLVGVAVGVYVGVGVGGLHSVRLVSRVAPAGLERNVNLFVAMSVEITPSLRRDLPSPAPISMISDVVGVPDVSVYW